MLTPIATCVTRPFLDTCAASRTGSKSVGKAVNAALVLVHEEANFSVAASAREKPLDLFRLQTRLGKGCRLEQLG